MPEASWRLLVDARPIEHPTARQRGIGHYTLGLLGGLRDIGAHPLALVGSPAERELVIPQLPGVDVEIHHPSVVRSAHDWYISTGFFLHPVSADPVPAYITNSKISVAGIMYDVIPYRFPELYQRDVAARRQALLRAPLARTIDAWLAISQFAGTTSVDELRLDPARVHVVGTGVEDRFNTSTADDRDVATRVLAGHDGGYVMSVTGGDERKNTYGLLHAWARLPLSTRSGRKLVVVAAINQLILARWEAWADEAGCRNEVIFTGAVSDAEMVALLHHAELAVMPSVEEGFGLPVAEAAACGCCAICSNLSSLPEVLDEPAACFDPHDPDAIAAAIDRALNDESHRAVLEAAGVRAAARWRWPDVARRAVAAIQDQPTLSRLGTSISTSSAHSAPKSQVNASRLVRLIAPDATSESGIGPYTARVTAALTKIPGVEVEFVADPSASSSRAMSLPLPGFSAGAIGPLLHHHDAATTIAILGNSPFHHAAWRLARAQPTHVWLHEVSLFGLHVGTCHLSGSEPWSLRYLAERLEADNLPADAAASILADDDPADRPRFLAEALRYASSAIVSSDAAAHVVRTIRPDLPTLVIPLAFPPVSKRSDTTPPGPVVVAAGWLAPNKRPDLVLESLVLLRENVAARVVFAGPAVDRTRQFVIEEAERLGLADSVMVTGRLVPADFSATLASARAGLQLRDDSDGAMSAALADLVSHGVPTVTTLTTAGSSRPGLTRLGSSSSAAQIADALLPLLIDDTTWADASSDAISLARSWTDLDVANALVAWISRK